MSAVAMMKSQCMQTIRTHIVGKSDFTQSDHKTRCRSFENFSGACKVCRLSISCIKFSFQKVSINRKYKSCQEMKMILRLMVCCPSMKVPHHFHSRIMGDFRDINPNRTGGGGGRMPHPLCFLSVVAKWN